MKLTENFIENLLIGIILLVLALVGASFLREKAEGIMSKVTEPVSKASR